MKPPCLPLSRLAPRAACAALALALALPAGAGFPLGYEDIVPDEVTSIIRKHGFPPERVGLLVATTDGDPLAALNVDRPFNIASVAKIFTTVAGIDILGYKHRWRTRVLHDGDLANGVLNGNLYIRGEGDPFLTKERFRGMLEELVRRGVRRIQGDVVLDDAHFDVPPHDPNAFDGAGLKPYNVGPSALLLNYKTFEVVFSPVMGEGRVSLFLDPPTDAVDIVDGVRLNNRRCSNWRSRITERYRIDGDTATIELKGRYPRSCGQQSFHVSLMEHTDYVGGVFSAYWRMAGGEHAGAVRTGETPKGARKLITHESVPLIEIVNGINKFSNNVMARQLFLAMGEAPKGTPKSLERSRRTLTAWMAENGINVEEFHIDNGSGLSRDVKATPRQAGELLLLASDGQWRHEVFSSFPVIGYDGTLRKRMRKSPIAGYGRLKTGSLRGARAVAGMLHHPGHEDVIFVAFVNWSKMRGASRMIDDLLKWGFGRMQANAKTQ